MLLCSSLISLTIVIDLLSSLLSRSSSGAARFIFACDTSDHLEHEQMCGHNTNFTRLESILHTIITCHQYIGQRLLASRDNLLTTNMGSTIFVTLSLILFILALWVVGWTRMNILIKTLHFIITMYILYNLYIIWSYLYIS